MELSVNILGKNPGKATVLCPGFVRLSKPASSEVSSYGLNTRTVYAFTAKGWDMKNQGREIYKIEGIGWVPSSHLEIVTGIIPN